MGVVTCSREKSLSLDDIDEGMFAIKFGVGDSVPPQQVTALLGISNLLTGISGCRRNDSSTFSCCAFLNKDPGVCCAECRAPCQRKNQGYTLVRDRFTFNSIVILQSYFVDFPPGANSSSPIGVISFSRSPYSVVSNIQTKQFSYFFSYNSARNSSIILGNNVSLRNGLESAQLIQDTNNYAHLYFVNLARITVGNKYVAIYPKTDFPYGVILDTIIPVTLLAEPAYEKVKSEIVAQMGQPVPNSSNSFNMCYSNSPHWPNLTLWFSRNSGYAQMVLTKENYVVADDDAGLECVAILSTSSKGFSVIGSMAQLDRHMIFHVEHSTLYFDQYPDIVHRETVSSCDTKPTFALNLVVAYFILLLLFS